MARDLVAELRPKFIRDWTPADKDAVLAEIDRLRAEQSISRAWFGAISGALVDAGCSVGDEATYADAVRSLVAERERIMEAARSAFARGQRNGYVLCQNALQKLMVQKLRLGHTADVLQESVDCLSAVQPPVGDALVKP